MLRKPVAYAVLFALGLAGCGDKSAPPAAESTTGSSTPEPTAKVGPTGKLKDLKIDDIKQGHGDGAATGDQVWVLYTGTFLDGTEFDSTAKHGNVPYKVIIGQGQVIQGWEKGLIGMKVGGHRKLSIPASLAYGDQEKAGIPVGSDLYFDMNLVAMVKKGDERTLIQREIKEGTGRAVKAGDTVTLDYEAKLPSGEVGDTSYKTHKPITFVVGKQQAMDGIDAGVVGMKVGGKRELVVPPALGPTQATKTIPYDTVLTITIEVRKIH